MHAYACAAAPTVTAHVPGANSTSFATLPQYFCDEWMLAEGEMQRVRKLERNETGGGGGERKKRGEKKRPPT